MPAYVPKFRRERCAHVYMRNIPDGPKRGEQCPKLGRLDRDGKYRCGKHSFKKYIHKNKDRIRREITTQMNQLARQLEDLQKAEEMYGCSRPKLH